MNGAPAARMPSQLRGLFLCPHSTIHAVGELWLETDFHAARTMQRQAQYAAKQCQHQQSPLRKRRDRRSLHHRGHQGRRLRHLEYVWRRRRIRLRVGTRKRAHDAAHDIAEDAGLRAAELVEVEHAVAVRWRAAGGE